MKEVLCARLGRIPYGSALRLQRRLHGLRSHGAIPDVLLALEHEPVITIGRLGDESHILADPRVLGRLHVEVFQVERGGDVTYHGPGQLVLYPILDLRWYGRDLHRYIAGLEEVMIRTARAFGVEAHRRSDFPGVWVGLRKLGSVGVHVKAWVTMHGLALNVDLHPNLFPLVVLCGLHGIEAVSLAELSGHPIPGAEVLGVALRAFSEVFEVRLTPVGEEVLLRWAG